MKAISNLNYWTNNVTLKTLHKKAPFGTMLQNTLHRQMEMSHL